MTKRKATVEKINKFLKKAQEDAPEEELPPEEAPEEEEAADEEPMEDVEAPPDADAESPVEDRIERLEETIETLVEGLESQKEVLDQLLSGQEPGEEAFEEYLEDTEEEGEDEITEDEFGVDEGDLITGRKDMTLREQRKARLASKQPRRGTSLGEHWNIDKSNKNKYKQTDPGPQKGQVPKHELPDMLKVAELSLDRAEDKKSWTVLDANDKPLFLIECAEHDPIEFAQKKFAEQVIRDMQKLGVEKAMLKYHARDLRKMAKAASTAAVDVKAAQADVRRRFTRALRLAYQAMDKNLLGHPLKAALFNVLSDLEIDQPERIIESAFAQASKQHTEVAIAQAEKYLDMTDEAFVETEAMISEAGVAQVAQQDLDPIQTSIDHHEASALARRAAAGSMPFSTASDDSSAMARLQNALPKPKLAAVAGQQIVTQSQLKAR